MVNLRKNEVDPLHDRSDIMLYRIYPDSLEDCHFHVFATFSDDSCWPSWTAQSHKFERTPFADHSD